MNGTPVRDNLYSGNFVTNGSICSLINSSVGHVNSTSSSLTHSIEGNKRKMNGNETRRFAVRRKDIRYCALSASVYPISVITEGMKVAYLPGGMQSPKRATVMSIGLNGLTLNVTDIDDEHGCVQIPT